MATGSLDANGIWIYGEDDSEATFSALLNKLGDSTSDVVAVLKQSGRVIQTVSVSKTDTFSSTSSAYVDITGLSATITPRYATSKILVIANITLGGDTGANVYPRLLRGSTAIGVGNASGSRLQVNGLFRSPDGYATSNVAFNYLDSPATTSSTTYKIQGISNVTINWYVNRSHLNQDSPNSPLTASTITLLEVSA